MRRDMTMKNMDRMEKEQERLRELHAMKAEGVGMVSLLDHEILAKSKVRYVARLRAVKDALRAIQATTGPRIASSRQTTCSPPTVPW